MNKNNELNKGFTLVETLVAISIFTMSILGLMSVLSTGTADVSYSKQKIIAGYLAEEGIESVRNIRDTTVLYNPTDAQTGWDAFKTSLTSASCSGAGCYVDATSLFSCGGSCPVLLYDNAIGKYGYATGTGSGFVRKIQTTQVSADEIKISSTVSWIQASGNYSIVLSEDLFNWIQ